MLAFKCYSIVIAASASATSSGDGSNFIVDLIMLLHNA